MTAPEELRRINDRAHLRTVHPDSLPWPVALPEEELAFYTRLCGLPPGRRDEARAYLAKELAQLADIERHISVCMGCLSGQAAESRMLGGVAMIDALMHFSAEECQHSNMFYRFVDLLLGRPLDRSGETLDARVGLFLGPESPESKLAALLGSAYPGESVITVFEHRARMLDPGHARFFTKMIRKRSGPLTGPDAFSVEILRRHESFAGTQPPA